MFGIEINFKNGDKDWIDPVFDDPIEVNGTLVVEGSISVYEYDLELVDKWLKYGLCETCGYDVRSYGCETGCVKP